VAVLAVSNLRKLYDGAEVVAGVSFGIAPGECFGLLGPNGAGKTTTSALPGLIDPDGGSIELVGEPVPKAAREARIRVGVVPQMDNLDPDFTVEENLLVYGRYFGIPERSMRERIPRLLDFAGLASRASARIQTLSGGMKRRLTLARALINDPDLLFMDEPTTGLDPQARHLIWERLKQLLAQGKTIVLTTHFMERPSGCARLAIMDHGRFITRAARGNSSSAYRAARDRSARRRRGMGGRKVEGSRRAWKAATACSATRPSAHPRDLSLKQELRYPPAGLLGDSLKMTGRSCDWSLLCPALDGPALRSVWRRNLLVWRKLAIPSILGNLADPLIYLSASGYGLGSMLRESAGCPTSRSSPPEWCARAR
jgi:lipooligosaccharide transport system ATP-binding protein